MVWIAVGLLCFTAAVVGVVTASGRWDMSNWRVPRSMAAQSGTFSQRPTFQQLLDESTAETARASACWEPPQAGAGVAESVATSYRTAVLSACQAVLDRSGFLVFSQALLLIFVSFLLPVWSLSFATEALGGEREARTLVWLFTRPLSRPAIYLAKFAALLPWSLGLNLGGFGLLCLAAGTPGRMAFELYWPAIAGATLAFSSLFHLLSACFRRAAVLAILYTFFLEIILSNVPGDLKRISIGFYTRCLMYSAAERSGVHLLDNPALYGPVGGASAWWMLAGMTVVLLAIGMVVFSRAEYRDES